VSETASSPTLTASDYLAEPLTVGSPDVFGGLAVYPVRGPAPDQPYISFAQGREAGVALKELEGGASVNDLLIRNPTDYPVLLFEGEEVLGAQQNRTFDVTALIGTHSQHQIPVSCVEAGRWDSSRRSEDFAPAPQTAHTNLRRRKAVMVQASLEAGGPARANQTQVWSEVDTTLDQAAANSPTRALDDAFEQHRNRLDRFNDAIRLQDGQSGALVALAGRLVVLDWVSRPEVFASLHSALIHGYALDAIEAEAAEPPSLEEANGFVSLALGARTGERDGIGLGREIRFAESSLIGSGLAAGAELVQLTVHKDEPSEAQSGTIDSGRIRRPSRRRR
jgi:hypothetical protein